MDLAADALHEAIAEQLPPLVEVEKIRPVMRRRFGGFPGVRGHRTTFNLDRLAGRFVDYPDHVRGVADRFDMFHIADHSYAHLAHGLPAGRCGVFLHDLDTFRCLIEPDREHRPWWFRRMARRVLTGLQGASVVFHSTNAVRDEVLRHGLVSADRLIHAPYGVAREFTPGATAVPFCVPYLLHVGSTIPRKRIDVLLDVFARVRKRLPRMQLIHVGADLTAEQHRHLDSLGLRDATSLLPTRTRAQVADLYRGAQLVLLPSDAEGFGLPVIEAMACGTNVVTSDLAVLREVGAGAVSYCAVGDIDQWTETIIRLIESPEHRPSSQLLEARAALYTWSAHARTIVDTYCELFDRLSPNVKSGGRKY